ncbi:photosystem II reaction center protein Psb28 [Synechococcales cyanobacterium C]|uniref:Photosystem II reaction center Psb28 protein n=1 Tax=Petrachloros mirabilis ULC683 TaxID=2781853 RepID=A0A8K2A2T8_9CYAN|nr:photosystem II reaction center protein Psb28 [Petrachloros mirabilis]NCJ08632.1 photosystem II reaction center protein Psb28 [Petrachloros mirabilis ULC683]
MADIQFVRGLNEPIVPDVKLTRAKDGSSGRALFSFADPEILKEGGLEILGMYMVDEEGELVTRDVSAKFINGQARGLEVVYTMKSADAWDRFMRFMGRYAESHGLGFTKSDHSDHSES